MTLKAWMEREGLAALERAAMKQLAIARIVLTDDWREARPVNVPRYTTRRHRGVTVKVRVPRRFR